MNKHLIALTGALLITGTTSVFAASTVDLTVKGIITPNACTPVLSGGGVIDHGKISAKDLDPDKPTHLPDQSIQLSITCDADTQIAFQVMDNVGDPAEDSTAYSLGLIGAQPVGGYYLSIESAVANGESAVPVSSEDKGSSWRAWKYINKARWSSVSQAADNTPATANNIQATVQVKTSINPGLVISDDVPFAGSATFTVMYL